MAYSKTTWLSTTVLDIAEFNNAETQYDEGYTYFAAHNHDDLYFTRTEMESTYWYNGNDGTGSGCDADLVYTSVGNKHYTDIIAASLVAGLIVMWEGLDAAIPAGWHKCDGTGGTIDLRDKFILCAGGAYAVGASGGSATNAQSIDLTVATHALTTAEIPSHTHTYDDYYAPGGYGGNGSYMTDYQNSDNTGKSLNSVGSGTAHGHTSSTVSTTATENMPASVALTYIQKV